MNEEYMRFFLSFLLTSLASPTLELVRTDSTLKNIGECVSKSTLRILKLEMNMPSGEAPVAEERAKEWLQCAEVGGKKLVQSLEDSHLQTLYIKLYYTTRSYFNEHEQEHQSRQTLKATAATVNTARRQKGLPIIDFHLLPRL